LGVLASVWRNAARLCLPVEGWQAYQVGWSGTEPDIVFGTVGKKGSGVNFHERMTDDRQTGNMCSRYGYGPKCRERFSFNAIAMTVLAELVKRNPTDVQGNISLAI
jgi:hypothetical protein